MLAASTRAGGGAGQTNNKQTISNIIIDKDRRPPHHSDRCPRQFSPYDILLRQQQNIMGIAEGNDVSIGFSSGPVEGNVDVSFEIG